MKEIKKNHSFRVLIPLFVSQTIGAFNDNGMKAMLPIMAAFQFGKASMDQTNQVVSILLILPFVVFAPWAGWVSDRFSKKDVVSLALLSQILGLGVLAGGLYLENLTIGLCGFFLLAVQSAFFSPGKKGILKELVGSDRLGMAVGWMEMLTMVGILGGAFVAAKYFDLLVPHYGGWGTGLVLCVVAIGLALFSWILFIPTPRTEAPRAGSFQPRVLWSHWGDLSSLWKNRKLRAAALGDAWFWSVGSFFYLVLVKLSGEVIEGEVGMGTLYGYWFLLLGVGIMLGSLLVAYLNRGRVELGLTPIGAFLLPLAFILLYFVDPFDVLFEWGCLLLGFSGALFFVPLNGFLQDQAGESERGRILAASNLLTQISSIGLILFHAFLSNSLGLSAKEEILLMSIPASIIAIITMKILLEDFFRALFHMGLRIFYRIKIEGMENFPTTRGVLLVSNHVSYADPVFIGAVFSRKIRYLAYSGLAHSRVMRGVFALTKTVTVSPDRSLESIKRSVAKLKNGMPLCVFAEGGISRMGTIFPFKRGVLLLAKQSGVPILPVHLDGVWGSIFSMERGQFFRKWPISFPYRVSVRVGKLIDPNQAGSEIVRSSVMDLGRLSFTARLPTPIKVKDCIQQSFRTSPQAIFFSFKHGHSVTRGEIASFLRSGESINSISSECHSYLNAMRAIFQSEGGPRKIWASFLRLREIHLWDLAGFKFAIDSDLNPEWIFWSAFLGNREILWGSQFIEVHNPKMKKGNSVQLTNGISTERNGLVSINFRSDAQLQGEVDELESGYKEKTFGRLLPGLSYQHDPHFGVIGIDGVLDPISNIEGIDKDGFLYPK